MVDLELVIAEKILTIGKIAGFIHCAGVEKTLPLKQSSEVFQSIFLTLMFFAGFGNWAKIISLKKYKAEKASFVFIASVAGMVGERKDDLFCKQRCDFWRKINVYGACKKWFQNSISPAMVKTPILEKMFDGIGEEGQNIIKKHPLGIGEPEDVANRCCLR